MSRCSSFFKAWRRAALFMVLAAAGCSPSQPTPYAPGQVIEMGPWKFAVERAQDSVQTKPGVGRMKTVTVTLKLVNHTERHEPSFDHFLMGYEPGAMIMFPKLKLVDEQGTPFDGSVSPTSGDSSPSERWLARFDLIPADAGAMADVSDLAPRYADVKLAQLELVIENPDHRSGQPHRAIIPLE